jgi:hypothetical protein
MATKAVGSRQRNDTGGTVTVTREEPQHVPTYYTNHTEVETSLWDVRLTLAESIEVDHENRILKVRSLANVRMSPQHARVVAGLLLAQLENYERQFGRIPQPAAKVEAPPEKLVGKGRTTR